MKHSKLGWSISRLGWSISRLVWSISRLGWSIITLGWSISILRWSISRQRWSISRLRWSISKPRWSICRLGWSISRLRWSISRPRWSISKLGWSIIILRWSMTSIIHAVFVNSKPHYIARAHLSTGRWIYCAQLYFMEVGNLVPGCLSVCVLWSLSTFTPRQQPPKLHRNLLPTVTIMENIFKSHFFCHSEHFDISAHCQWARSITTLRILHDMVLGISHLIYTSVLNTCSCQLPEVIKFM